MNLAFVIRQWEQDCRDWNWKMGMPGIAHLSLWAVHISDGVLTAPWLVGGFVLAGLLAFLGAWRIQDEEIPKVAVLTAVFFVASLIHVAVPPTSVHLLLNGLLGVILGRRALLAIPVGLFLQAALIGHGGFTTLGVNSCVLGLPALLAGQGFAALRQVSWLHQAWFRAGLVAASAFVWQLGLVFSLTLLMTGKPGQTEALDTGPAIALICQPMPLTVALVLAAIAAWFERRLENRAEFPLGLLVGEITVLATTFLNAAVLVWGGREDWHIVALLVFVAHLPIAVIEGLVLGFTVAYLARVKPEMLGRPAAMPYREAVIQHVV